MSETMRFNDADWQRDTLGRWYTVRGEWGERWYLELEVREGVGCEALADALAAAERELEGVRKVEDALRLEPSLTNRVRWTGTQFEWLRGRIGTDTVWTTGVTLAALGHALPDDTAQEGR